MNVWSIKTFSTDEGQAIDEVAGFVEDLFKALGSPRHMTLISFEDEESAQLFLELPHIALLSVFAGFERIDPKSVPRGGDLLVGFEDRFERQFRSQPASAI